MLDNLLYIQLPAALSLPARRSYTYAAQHNSGHFSVDELDGSVEGLCKLNCGSHQQDSRKESVI